MTAIKDPKIVMAAVIVGTLAIPAVGFSRVNSLTGGIGTSYDYSDRSYSSSTRTSDKYQAVSLRPSLDFETTSEKDSIHLGLSPSLKYDLENSETDWDSNFVLDAARYMTKSWQLRFYENYLRTDYYNDNAYTVVEPTTPTPDNPVITDPTLTTDLGRRRYWRNTLNVLSNHFYRQDSLFQVGFNYIALRNDNSSGVRGYDDYDRYVASVLDEHRFNAVWSGTADLSYVVGNYDNLVDTTAIPAQDNLGRDLKEYHARLGVVNESIIHNPISLDYYFVDTDYQDPLRSDVYLSQARLTWKREYSPHLYTRLGAGPSYGKSEGSSGEWAVNGIAEVNYLIEHGFFNFTMDKRYEMQNFSGNTERGALDAWNSRFLCNYRLLQDLTAVGSLSYLYEDHKYQFSDTLNLPDSYHKDVYIANVGLDYNFWQYFTASVGYSYVNQDSDRLNDSYDEHRVLLTLSWQKEFYRW